jgi:ubiquinone/menaquinone biosynthesis C-methylase UbiE
VNLPPYVHGRSDREAERLIYQASRFAELFHQDTRYPAGSRVLEAACGVGAQTIFLAAISPAAEIVALDLSRSSVVEADRRLRGAGYFNVAFQVADVFSLPYRPGVFDHIFVCFLLEHLSDPLEALLHMKTVLRPGGTITIIEGDHGSAVFFPDSPYAHRVIECQVELQNRAGGNARIGREIGHLMNRAGFSDVIVSPQTVFAEAGHPESVEAVRSIFVAMIEGVREQALTEGLVDPETWDRGIRDLLRTTKEGGTFTYTFFKGVGSIPEDLGPPREKQL